MSKEIINGVSYSIIYVFSGAYYFDQLVYIIAAFSLLSCLTLFFRLNRKWEVKWRKKILNIKNIGREMINIDWNGYDNMLWHIQQFYVLYTHIPYIYFLIWS